MLTHNRCYWLNVGSLICGFLGNLFLLFNFTQRIRYIIALPATIIFWFLASGLLIAITVSMQVWAPPIKPDQTYTQGFWYAISAAVFYLLCSVLLMISMLGYFLGRYSDSFVLTDSQRTLILQTMSFFIWLGGGAALFSSIERDASFNRWHFSDAVYFCDVTILTVGFGDFYPVTNVGRGIVIPYSVGGIVILALIVNSIYKFMGEIGEQNIIQRHTDRIRARTRDRAVANSFDFRQREDEHHRGVRKRTGSRLQISMPTQPRVLRTAINENASSTADNAFAPTPSDQMLKVKNKNKKPRAVLLREEKDRFQAMRNIQRQSSRFRKWIALLISVVSFGVLWGVGAVVFWQAEKKAQGMTYFQALYFCYISLLTIGYGDLAPKSNAGRTFFVVWSLIAVPAITVLVSDMGDTVVHLFKKWSSELADFTVLPKHGIWGDFFEKHPWLLQWILGVQAKKAMKKRLKRGFETADPDAPEEPRCPPQDDADVEEQLGIAPNDSSHGNNTTVRDAAADPLALTPASSSSISQRLALSIKRVAADLRNPSGRKQYEYEDWVEFTHLIRATRGPSRRSNTDGEDEELGGLVEWDWLGRESPMMSGVSEPEWLLQRLCESLVRMERHKAEGFLVDGPSRDVVDVPLLPGVGVPGEFVDEDDGDSGKTERREQATSSKSALDEDG